MTHVSNGTIDRPSFAFCMYIWGWGFNASKDGFMLYCLFFSRFISSFFCLSFGLSFLIFSVFLFLFCSVFLFGLSFLFFLLIFNSLRSSFFLSYFLPIPSFFIFSFCSRRDLCFFVLSFSPSFFLPASSFFHSFHLSFYLSADKQASVVLLITQVSCGTIWTIM